MSPARILAPLALATCAIVFIVIVLQVGGGAPTVADEKAKAGSVREKSRSKSRSDRLPKKYYVVKTGDTLTAISSKVGVPMTKLQKLNPNSDPQALVSGQKLRIR